MLSKNAFNALLKTLEEPPSGVTFILVTTEPNKLLPTVVSRCQKYEFQDVALEILKEHYRTVAEAEGLPITEEGLNRLALTADGSVRDGLTLLQTSGEAASDSSKEYFNLVGAIYNQDVITALDVVQELRKVNEPRTIIQMLEKWFYWCSLESFGMKTPVRDYFGDTSSFDLGRLQSSFKTCLEIERNFTATPNSKIVLDMGIIKLCL
jgi:DNA polymerase III gamma/tau subunit